jgi:hypothetical protein
VSDWRDQADCGSCGLLQHRSRTSQTLGPDGRLWSRRDLIWHRRRPSEADRWLRMEAAPWDGACLPVRKKETLFGVVLMYFI